MGVPSTRTPVRIARGTYSNLTTTEALASLQEGEICFATDENRLYLKEGAGLTSVSSTKGASPTPAQVTSSPAFTGGTGTQSDPYLITNGSVPFAGGTANSAQELTIQGTAGDIVVFTDNSPGASANRFKSQDVGIVNSNGEFKLNLKYNDAPLTSSNNTTYTGNLQIGSVYITWVVVQSNLNALSQSSATTISVSAPAVGGTATATEGVITGGTPAYTYVTRWQRSFTGTGGWFDTGINGTSYTIVSADSGYYIRAVTTGTDSTAGSAGGPLTFELPSVSSSQINVNAVASVNSVVLSANNINSNRFTSETFKVTATMAPEGVPTTTKGLKVEFAGSLNAYPQTDNVSSTTSGDPIGTNVNQTNLLGTRSDGGQSSSSGYYQWIAPMFYAGVGGAGFINMATAYPYGTGFQGYWTDEYGISNDNPYNSSALQNSWNGQWYTDTTLTTNRNWYQTSGASTSSQSIQNCFMYKPDCVMIRGSQGGWMTIDNFSQNKSSAPLNYWKPIAHNHTQSGDSFFSHVIANGTRYSVISDTSNTYVMEGDVTDYNNCTSTTLAMNWITDFSLPSSYTNPAFEGSFAHGTKITIPIRYYKNSSNYIFRLYTCDFSVNDGTSKSHWVFKKEIDTGNSTGVHLGLTPVNPQNTNQILLTFGASFDNGCWYSSDGGETYSNRSQPSPQGWQRENDVKGMIWHRGKLLAIMRAYATYNGSGTTETNRFWVLAQSSDTGLNWTVAQYTSNYANAYNNYQASPNSMLNSKRFYPLTNSGGWIFGAGVMAYGGTTAQYYRSGLWIKDQDTVNLAGTTNLTNNSIREGDAIIQPGTSPLISANILSISGTTLKCANFNGGTAFENNKPLQNTVSWFGGTTAKLYGLMDTGGNVSDLVASDPGFVNVGYGVENTITLPATFPSGNSPDFEIPVGSTMKSTVTFTNTSGTITATTNTLTPS